MNDYTKSDDVMNALRLKSKLQEDINNLISEYEKTTGLRVSEIDLRNTLVPGDGGFVVVARDIIIRVEL